MVSWYYLIKSIFRLYTVIRHGYSLVLIRSNSYQHWNGSERRKEGRKEGNVLFNDALNTFYIRLYGVGHMVEDHSDSERGNPLPPHRLLFPISSKGYIICTYHRHDSTYHILCFALLRFLFIYLYLLIYTCIFTYLFIYCFVCSINIHGMWHRGCLSACLLIFLLGQGSHQHK